MPLNCEQITLILQEILIELKAHNDQQKPPEDETLLLPEEICTRLRVSMSTLKSYRKKGLPFFIAGNRIYYRWSEVLHYMRTNAHRKNSIR